MGGKIIKEKLVGQFVDLREIQIDDAEFVLKLRCDEKKSEFLHKTEFDLDKQVDYIKKYQKLDNEWYFIILNKKGEAIGTNRIYDIRDDSFATGSWIMTDGNSGEEIFESDYLTRLYGFDTLGFSKTHFDVSFGNDKVIKYHKMLGAKIISEDEIGYHFELSKEDFKKKAELWLKLYKQFNK